MHDVAKDIIDQNDINCGPSKFRDSALRWDCNNHYLIFLKFYTNINYPYQFTYLLIKN